MKDFFFALEFVGTAAFAISGAVEGLKKKMDIFGVIVLGVIAACGGGLLRDIFLGKLPPAMFSSPVYAITAVAVSVITFIAIWFKIDGLKNHFTETVMLTADSIGLGIFTSVGVAAAYDNGFKGVFFTVFLGTVTGVGGGLMRDILAGNPPYIFVKHIYACASIIGALVCCALWDTAGRNLSMIVCCIVIIAIRFLSAYLRLGLPKIKETEDRENGKE